MSNSLNLGVNLGNYSISAGIGGGLNESTDKYSLMDINNDGFVDLCYLDNNTLKVYYNNGSSFLQNAQTIDNISIISKNKSYNIGANGSFTVGVPLFPFIKLTGTPYADLSFNFSTDRARLTDINGDGFIDYLYVDNSGNTHVRYGMPRKTNILKQVKTPTGAKYYCDYELKYPNRENPNSKWVMASLKVYDGFVGDGVDTTYYKFKYENPKYHRMERESFGYETVITEQYNNNNQIYKKVIEKYHNQDYLFKGLKKYEVIYNAMSQKYVETEYKWDKKEITTGRVVIDSLITCFGPYYPAISMETKRYYEGQSIPSIITKKLYEHGKYGNVIQYVNEYDSSYIEDNLKSNIHYTYDLNNHLLEMADEIKVYDYADNMLQHREASYDNYGKMTQMRVFNNSEIAYTDLQYDQYGNVIQILYPQDVNGDRLSFSYEYDPVLNTYPTRITDFWNNSMHTDYDYRLGLPTKVQDPSGNFVQYTYYEDGKLNTVTAPNEINNGAPYTIKCDYWTNHNSSLSSDSGLWAQTLHYDPINVGNEFETVTISDGLGRAIQVKKKSTIYGVDSVIVSGKIIFDAFGRKITEYQPETEVYSGTINRNYSNLSWQNPTTYSYDIMDRPIQQNNPDGTHIIYSYNFGQDNFGKICFKTNITDPNGNITEQYKDARNLQTTVVAPMNTITKFIYTPLGQIKTSIDPEGNATHYNYDMLGRLIEREHPDAGITQYQYDIAGNILQKISENSNIEYIYEEGRLKHIHYPGNDEMDVYYEYGAAGSGNQSGRLIKQQDASGVQTFWYGNMGELIGNIHTYVVPGGESYTFEMRWNYDSWNRLINIQYPDGELVNYQYDNGGKLIRMNGEKLGEQYHYIDMINYDKFDSRTFIHYGNGTYSEYYYDPLNRRLKNLKSYDAGGQKMHDIEYGYDGVGNILHQYNHGEYVYNGAGGPYNYDYNYDGLYRLIHSEGNFESNNNGNMYYNLNMSYSPSGNITNKQLYAQTLINGGVNNIDYNRNYQYNGRPHQVTNAGENEYEWDGNGNMIFRNTPHSKRYQCWDNEDRLVAVHDAGDMPQLSAYLYDGGGERVWKLTGGVIQNYMNGEQIYNRANLDKTLYASPYMVMTEQEYTKHYYIEGERVCSKIGGGFEWAHTPPTSPPIDFIVGGTHIFSMQLRDMVERNTHCAKYDGDMYIEQYLPPAHNDGNEYENLQYFYHPDHLGSASFVTNAEGAVCQHLQYLPFGELFVSQRNSEFDSRYKFTAKELDNETSYTYFGARYYDSDLSVWLSMDPMSDMRSWVSPYAYCQNNPIILVDPRGMIDDNYRIYYDGTIEKDETNDPTNTYIYVNSDYEETNLGTYQVEKNSMGEDMVRAGNGATGSNGIYRWVGIISGNLYFPEDAFAALLGGIQDFYENVGQNVDLVQINQFMSLDRVHSFSDNRRPCLDIAYYDQNGKTGVHTDNPNVSYNLNYKLFQSLRYFKLGSYDTYTSTARGSKIPYLSETTGSKGHENHFHIEGYDKSNLFIFRNIMLPTITIIGNKINN